MVPACLDKFHENVPYKKYVVRDWEGLTAVDTDQREKGAVVATHPGKFWRSRFDFRIQEVIGIEPCSEPTIFICYIECRVLINLPSPQLITGHINFISLQHLHHSYSATSTSFL